MTAPRVVPVRTRGQLRDFLRLPVWDGRTPTHAVPLWDSTVRRWWSGRGPHREHGPVELYLAVDSAGTVRGRTTLHTDSRMDARLGEATLLMGATEFADRAALSAMVDHALTEARSRGRSRLLGPVSLLPNQVGGVITSGFEEPGFLDGPWNPEHYPSDWAALGFERVWTGSTWRCEDVSRLDPDEIFPVGPLPEGVVLRRGSRRHLDQQLPVLREMLNAAFAELGYYNPIEADELEAATDGLAHLLDERLLLWLERPAQGRRRTDDRRTGEPLAFVLVVPDLTEFVRSTRGRLSPVDMVRLLATRGRYRRDAVLIIKGTVPGARGQGLMRHLSHELLVGLRAGGYRNLSVTFIEDDNAGSQAQFVAMGGRPLHDTTFFTRAVDEAEPPAGTPAERPEDTPAERLMARSADWGRAPSAHNTQPWRVEAVDDRTLSLGWHADRELPVADPTRRDLYLGLGAVALALRIVAQDIGLRADVTWQVDPARRHAAVLSLVQDGEVASSPGLPWTCTDLRARATSRAAYPAAPTEDEVRGLSQQTAAAMARMPSGEGDPEVVVLPDALVTRLLPAATARTLTGPAAQELGGWLRLHPGHPRHDLDGLSAEALGLSAVEASGMRLLGSTGRLGRPLRRVLAAARLDRVIARTSAVRPRGTVVALCTPQGCGPEEFAELGQHLLALWLAGQRAGWHAHPLSELIDAPRSAATLDQHATSRTGRPTQVVAVWRWGRPEQPPPSSPRITD